MRGTKRAAAEEHREPRAREVPGGQPEAVRVWLLGGFRVSVGSRTIGEQQWRLKKAAGLIKVLALAEGHRMHREQAMEMLWPDLDPEAALNNLHQALHVARRTLEPSAPAISSNAASRYLHLREERLTLCPEGPLWVDVEAFEEAAAAARHAPPEPAALKAALDLYAGELLPQDRYEPWAEERRAELRGAYLSLLLELAGAYEGRGQLGAAIEALERVVAEEPTHEGAHAGLMRLYALSGRHHEAILQFERLRKAFREELDEEPTEAGRRLYEEIRAGRFSAAPPSPLAAGRPSGGLSGSSPNNLPASLTSFIGREGALLEVKRLLSMTRLLTLTGVGGSGKTRLALGVAHDLVGTYPDGVWLVELAPLADPALVGQAVAQALGVREQPGRSLTDTLAEHLRRKDLLLVVDNCEHLVGAVARLVEALLKACPKLRVLATSREPLGVPGEAVWTVPPLSLPDAEGASSVEGLMGAEAVKLFVDRARSRLPGFGLSEENAGAVARICRKLEGIPLAIELAAARMGALAVEQVAQRLEDSLKLLSGGRTLEPRQQTLRATLDWSHELLSEPEQRLFGRLSVFAGGFALEAAEEVCSREGIEREEVLDLLSKLVEKSLVVVEHDPGGPARYRLLEVVRQYALERLMTRGQEAPSVHDRHAAFFVTFAEQTEPELLGPGGLAAQARLEREHDNCRAALRWLVAQADTERAQRLAGALGRFWFFRGYLSEGEAWTGRVLALPGGDRPTAGRAKTLFAAGVMTLARGEYATVERTVAEARDLWHGLGDHAEEGFALFLLGHSAQRQGELRAARAFLEEGLALSRAAGQGAAEANCLWALAEVALDEGDDGEARAWSQAALARMTEVGWTIGISVARRVLGAVSLRQGDYQTATELLEASVADARQLGARWWIAETLAPLGQLTLERGDVGKARTHLVEGLAVAQELADRAGMARALEGLAQLGIVQGKPRRALRLAGAAAGLRDSIHAPLAPVERSRLERRLARARRALGERATRAAWSEGRAMPLGRAVEYALSEEEEPEPPTCLPASEQQPPPADEGAERLTRREQEIALLVGRGLTNRQIASELSISERTVHSHLRNILKKLGLPSRAGLAAWVSQRRV